MTQRNDIDRSDDLLEEVGKLPDPSELPDDEELADLLDDDLFESLEDHYCEDCGSELDGLGECPECDIDYDEDWPEPDSSFGDDD